MGTHSSYRNNCLVFWDTYRMRWLRAIGANVVEYIYNGSSLPTDDTTGDPTEFTLTPVEVGAGTSTVVQSVTAGNGMLFTTAGNENDGVSLQLKGESFKFESDKPLYLGAKMTLSSATESDLLFGMCITDTALLGGMTDGAYFECLDGSTDINFVTEKGSTETTTGTAMGTMDTSAHIYEIYWDGTTMHAYLDGTETALTQTNIPDDEDLTVSIEVLNGDAAAMTLNVHWLRAIQLR